jgi:hypothetical protein
MKSTENQEKSQKEGNNLNTLLPEFTGSSAHAAFPSDHNSVCGHIFGRFQFGFQFHSAISFILT